MNEDKGMIPPDKIRDCGQIPADEERRRLAASWTTALFTGFFNGRVTPFTGSVITPILEKAVGNGLKELGAQTDGASNLVADVNGALYVNALLFREKLNQSGVEFGDFLVGNPENSPDCESRRSFRKRFSATLRAKSAVKALRKTAGRFVKSVGDAENRITRGDLRGKSDAALYLLFDKAADLTACPAVALRQLAVLRSNQAHAAIRGVLRHCGVGNVPAAHSEILAGIPDNRMATRTWKLARLAASIVGVLEKIRFAENWGAINADLARIEGGKLFLKRLNAFLNFYGDRCAGLFELSQPRWSESPEELCSMICSMAEAGETLDPEARRRIAAAKAKEARKKIAKRAGVASGRLLKTSLESAKEADSIKIEMDDLIAEFMADVRALAIEAGRRFEERSLIARKEDVFLLKIDEIKKELAMEKTDYELADVVEERREQILGQSEKPPPLEIPEPEGKSQEPNLFQTERILYGKTASAGSYTGVARVVSDPSLVGRLKAGDVLIVRETDPCLDPLLTVCGAAVAESDDFLSGTAMTARFLGIPFVMAVPKASDEIETGDALNVDGFDGKITIMKSYE